MFSENPDLRKFLRKLHTSKSGGVLIYVAFGLPMLLGAMALSIDLGRAFILNTELKDFSDAVALAGAAELDGDVGWGRSEQVIGINLNPKITGEFQVEPSQRILVETGGERQIKM